MSIRKNLIILSFDYPPSTGGVARLCHEITLGMQKYYGVIKVITSDSKGTAQPHNLSKNIEIIKVSSKRVKCEYEVFKILRKLRDKKAYDVLCGLWHPEAFLAQLAGMKHIFILAHGAELLPGNSKFRKYFWFPIYGRQVIQNAKKVISNSRYTKGLVSSVASKAVVEALPLGVDSNFFSPSKESSQHTEVIKFCTVARILDFKGHDFILKTFESLPENLRSKIEWNIAGTGPHSNKLTAQINASPIKKQINIWGFVPDEALPDFYRNNDVFILATRAQKNSNQVEGFGLVFLEAQSSGLPCIGTYSGGIGDAIEEDNGGWLFDQDNITSLNKVLIPLLKNKQVINKHGVKARERVLKHCTWEIYCETLYNLMTV